MGNKLHIHLAKLNASQELLTIQLLEPKSTSFWVNKENNHLFLMALVVKDH